VGIHDITITVDDGNGGTDVLSFRLEVIEVNDPPEITSDLPSLLEVPEDETYTLDLTGVDEENDDLTWSDDTDLFDISPTNGTIIFLPTQSEVGEWWVNITTEDSGGLMDVVLISFAVLNVNDAPVIMSLSPENGSKYKEGKVVTFSVEPYDEDGDGLTVRWMDGEILLGTGKTLDYSKLKAGERVITVTVSDGQETVEDMFTVVIKKEEEGPAFSLVAAMMAVLVAAVVAYNRRDRY
jgi:hypothetical protein